MGRTFCDVHSYQFHQLLQDGIGFSLDALVRLRVSGFIQSEQVV